ncbi:hypothetical protein GF373_17625 [bacterium]|nr:hypothetical protein [bacterium]
MGEKDQAIVKALGGILDRLEGLEANGRGGAQFKDLTGAQTAQPMHGPGGLFSTYGLEDSVINLSLTPKGIASALPAFGSVLTNPLYSYITGFEGTSGDEPVGPCEDCPTGGAIETCAQTAVFGRICRASKEIEINEVMKRLNRGEMTDYRVIGSVLGETSMAPSNMEPADWINYVTRTQMVTVGIEFQRKLAPMLWTGNPANNTGSGGYKEFPGFDYLITTGKVDAESGAACPSLDSDIKSFGYSAVDGSSKDIVEYLSAMEFYLRHIAQRTGLDPVDWVIVMRPELWFELSAIWACRYMTTRCDVIDGPNIDTQPTLDAADMTELRDQLRKGSFLMINGRRYPVITDDGVYEQNYEDSQNLGAGEFASDIYFMPLRAKNMPVTYLEYADFSDAVAPNMIPAGQERWWATDGGRYMWTVENQKWCFKVSGKVEPRLIVRTPQLAGRITDVKYTPLQHLRSPFPDDPYFVKGGVETRESPSYNDSWGAPPR